MTKRHSPLVAVCRIFASAAATPPAISETRVTGQVFRRRLRPLQIRGMRRKARLRHRRVPCESMPLGVPIRDADAQPPYPRSPVEQTADQTGSC